MTQRDYCGCRCAVLLIVTLVDADFFFFNRIVSIKILYYSSCTSHVHRPLVCGSQEKKI